MQKGKLMMVFFLAFSSMMTFQIWAGENPVWLDPGREALGRAMSEIGLPKGDRNILVLTNAGYGSVGDQSTEAFLDIVPKETGASMGTRSLLPLHTGIQEPLWCSLYRKDTGKIVFLKWTGRGFRARDDRCIPAQDPEPGGLEEGVFRPYRSEGVLRGERQSYLVCRPALGLAQGRNLSRPFLPRR
jgi:hypothetical protein